MPEHIGENTTVAVILRLLRSIDASLGCEFAAAAIQAGDEHFHRLYRTIYHFWNTRNIEALFTGKVQRFAVLPFKKLQRQYTHLDKV